MKNLPFLLCIMILLCGGCKYFKKQTRESVEIVSTDSVANKEIYDSSAYYIPDEPVSTTQVVQQNYPANGKYHVIVGSFKVSGNADRYAEKIRGLGYDGRIIDGVNNFQLVAARSYNSYRESLNEIGKFRNEITPNAWVYRQR